jgi:hypothetical protein
MIGGFRASRISRFENIATFPNCLLQNARLDRLARPMNAFFGDRGIRAAGFTDDHKYRFGPDFEDLS